MRSYCTAQGTLLSGLWWPKWEGNPQKRGCTYNWFPLQSSRNQHNIAKQLYFSKVFFFKKGLKQSGPHCVLHCVSLYHPLCLLRFSHRNPAAPHTSLLSGKFLTRICMSSMPPFVPKDLSSSQQGLPWSPPSTVVHAHMCAHILCLTGKQKNSQLPWDSLIWKWEDWWRAHFWGQMWYKIMQIKAFLLSLEIKMYEA